MTPIQSASLLTPAQKRTTKPKAVGPGVAICLARTPTLERSRSLLATKRWTSGLCQPVRRSASESTRRLREVGWGKSCPEGSIVRSAGHCCINLEKPFRNRHRERAIQIVADDRALMVLMQCAASTIVSTPLISTTNLWNP